MRIDVLGVGEAFDPHYENASVVVLAEGFRLLIDCGASVQGPLLRRFPDPDGIDAVFFTHLHPDHVFGFVPVLLNWRDDGRCKALHVLASAPVRAHLEKLIELGATGLGSAWPFEIIWHDVPETRQIGPFETRFACTDHSVQNHAILVTWQGQSFGYSGDGDVTEDTSALFTRADLVFQEAYLLAPDPAVPSHCNLERVLEMAEAMPDLRIWLYHIRRDVRAAMVGRVADHPRLRVAVPGEAIEIR